MNDDQQGGGATDSKKRDGGIFSTAYSPSRDELLSRQVQARINQQQLAEQYARKRLENTYKTVSHPLEEKIRQKPVVEGRAQGPETSSFKHVEIPASKVVSFSRQLQKDATPAEEPGSSPQENQNTNYVRTGGPSEFDAKRYHAAWQNYYKNYFGRYYQSYYQNYHNQLSEHHGRLQAQMKLLEEKAKNGTASKEDIDEITRIKQEIVNNVKLKAKKVRQNHHFWPSVIAASVLLFLLFFQYNPIIVGAARQYIKPSDTATVPSIVAPGSDSKVSQDPIINIPKIGVQSPVVYDVTGLYDSDVQPALEKGVVRYNFPGTVLPGEKGNVVLIGHSSNNVFNPGKYNYIFVNLNKLVVDDTISINYQGIHYVYKVTATEVVNPSEFKYISDPVEGSTLTLMTCAPPGTNRSRLFVRATQISPNPDKNQESTAPEATVVSDDSANQNTVLPGTAPSVWDRIFGGN
jgi:LPXTG-site transpeptidase (sortase) family protein